MNYPVQSKSLAFYLQLLGEVVSHYGSERRKQGGQEDANITDVNGNVEKV